MMQVPQTKEVLNQLVADLSQMSAVVHQVHWYMRGPEFLHLHPLMDDFREDLDEQLDEIAERLITLDGAPASTLEEFAELTGIKDAHGTFGTPTPERLATLLEGYRYLADVYQHGIEVSGAEGDDTTQDLFIGFKGATEKRIWMLTAQLNQAPEIAED